jgi:potassium efflux system protein
MTLGVVRAQRWTRLGVLVLVAALPWRVSLAVETPTPAPVPTRPALSVSEVVRRTEDARARLQDIEQALSDDLGVRTLDGEIAQLSTKIDRTFADTSRRLAETPTLSAVRDLRVLWRQIASDLADAERRLTARTHEVEALADKLSQLTSEWGEVRTALAQAEVPAAVQVSVDDIAAKLADRRGTVRARQEQLLALQERVSRSRQRAAEADTEILQWERDRVDRVFQPDTMPLWRQSVFRDAAAVGEQLTRAVGAFVKALHPYLQTRSAALLVELLLVLLLAVLLRVAGRVMGEWPERTPEMAEFRAIAERPLSAAVVVGAIFGLWANAYAPRAFWNILALAGIIAFVRLAKRIIGAHFVFLVYALAACFLVGLVGSVLGSSAPLLQLVLAGETLLASVLTLWVVRRRVDRFGPRAAALVRFVGPLLSALFAIGTALAASGYLDLTQLVVQFSLSSALMAVVLMVSIRILSGLVIYLLRVRPLANLRMVRRNRGWMQHLVRRGLIGGAVLLWAFFVLRNVGLFDPALSAAAAVLDVGFSRGKVTITLGDLVGFGVTLCVAWLLSAFIRFVLEEDVYPRVTLPRGVSYALSTLVHYTLLTFGFFLALGVAGVDLTKATILAGALGVGVGFGLQNIVNNFVSGLILLFERPVQVGDAVTIGDVNGHVKHIGIRSSTVRTWDGSEVIFPNAALIADPVTNWTLSDRRRRLTLTVGVAYGTDPATVVDLLRGVAVAHEAVIGDPEPQALFMGFGDSALNFELRAWTDRADAWVPVQSDLYLALHAALTKAGITIPFPQRDVHLDAAQPVPVQVVGGDAPRDAE